MHKLDNGLFYTVEHYRLPDFSYEFRKKGKPIEDDLTRFMPSAKIWFLESGSTWGTYAVLPHTTGGKTIVYLRNEAKEVLATGVALCSMSETYSYKFGKELALKRALENYAKVSD